MEISSAFLPSRPRRACDRIAKKLLEILASNTDRRDIISFQSIVKGLNQRGDSIDSIFHTSSQSGGIEEYFPHGVTENRNVYSVSVEPDLYSIDRFIRESFIVDIGESVFK